MRVVRVRVCVCVTSVRGQLIGARSHAPTPSTRCSCSSSPGEHVTRSRASGELSGPLPRPPRSLIDLSPSLEHTHGFMQLKLSFLRISRVHPVDYPCLCWRTWCFPGSFSNGLCLCLSCLRVCVRARSVCGVAFHPAHTMSSRCMTWVWKVTMSLMCISDCIRMDVNMLKDDTLY